MKLEVYFVTKTGLVYHGSSDGVNTWCGRKVGGWQSKDAQPELSSHDTVKEAVDAGLVCGNCLWHSRSSPELV